MSTLLVVLIQVVILNWTVFISEGKDGEDRSSINDGVKFSKKSVVDSGERSSEIGEVMSRTKAGGEWLYKILSNNDGNSEELTSSITTRKERVSTKIIDDGVDHSDSESECE